MTAYNTPSFIRHSIEQIQTIAAVVEDSIPHPTSAHGHAAYAAAQRWRAHPLGLAPYLRTQAEGTALARLSFLNLLVGTFDDAACDQLVYVPSDRPASPNPSEDFLAFAFHPNEDQSDESHIPLHALPPNLSGVSLKAMTTYPDLKQGDNLLIRFVNEIAAFSSLYAALIRTTATTRDMNPAEYGESDDLLLLATAYTEVFGPDNVEKLSRIFYTSAELLGISLSQGIASFTRGGDNPLEDRNHIIWSLPGMVELEDIYHSSEPDLAFCKNILHRGLMPTLKIAPSGTIH